MQPLNHARPFLGINRLAQDASIQSNHELANALYEGIKNKCGIHIDQPSRGNSAESAAKILEVYSNCMRDFPGIRHELRDTLVTVKGNVSDQLTKTSAYAAIKELINEHCPLNKTKPDVINYLGSFLEQGDRLELYAAIGKCKGEVDRTRVHDLFDVVNEYVASAQRIKGWILHTRQLAREVDRLYLLGLAALATNSIDYDPAICTALSDALKPEIFKPESKQTKAALQIFERAIVTEDGMPTWKALKAAIEKLPFEWRSQPYAWIARTCLPRLARSEAEIAFKYILNGLAYIPREQRGEPVNALYFSLQRLEKHSSFIGLYHSLEESREALSDDQQLQALPGYASSIRFFTSAARNETEGKLCVKQGLPIFDEVLKLMQECSDVKKKELSILSLLGYVHILPPQNRELRVASFLRLTKGLSSTARAQIFLHLATTKNVAHLGEFFKQCLDELPRVPIADITQLAQDIKLTLLSEDDRQLLFTRFGELSLATRQQITEHCLIANLSFSYPPMFLLTLINMWELDPQPRETAIRTVRSSHINNIRIGGICKLFFLNFIDQVPYDLHASASELLGFLIGDLDRSYTVQVPNRSDDGSVLRACREVADVLVARNDPASVFSSFAFGVLRSTGAHRKSSQNYDALCEILKSGGLLIQARGQNQDLLRLIQTIETIQHERASRSKLNGQQPK